MRSRGIVGVVLVWCHAAALVTGSSLASTWGLPRGLLYTHTRCRTGGAVWMRSCARVGAAVVFCFGEHHSHLVL